MTAESPSCNQCQQLRAQLTEKEAELAELRSQIEELGRMDSMTGVLNYRTLMEVLQLELQRAQRTGHPFCFAVLDLDAFKAVNDRHGHQAGDAVLKKAAETSIGLLRTIDRFGRIGGERFGIVLPATWLDQGAIAMARLSKAIGGCDWGQNAAGLTLTFSAGLTTNALGDTTESMLKRAEAALAQAKAEGGNRTVQAEEPLPIAPPAA